MTAGAEAVRWRCVLNAVVLVSLMPLLVSAAEISPRPKNVLLNG